MQSIFKFFRVTMLWILLLPPVTFFLGAASNQLVLIANHDKFPVMLNDRAYSQQDGYGMLDGIHCVMTPQTHLNFLADLIDTQDSHESIGDILIGAADWLYTFCFYVWVALVVKRLCRD